MNESGNKTQDLLNSYIDGVITERERILQAVELWRNNLLNGEPYTDEELAAQRDGGYSDNFDYLIAIIKGEQK